MRLFAHDHVAQPHWQKAGRSRSEELERFKLSGFLPMMVADFAELNAKEFTLISADLLQNLGSILPFRLGHFNRLKKARDSKSSQRQKRWQQQRVMKCAKNNTKTIKLVAEETSGGLVHIRPEHGSYDRVEGQ